MFFLCFKAHQEILFLICPLVHTALKSAKMIVNNIGFPMQKSISSKLNSNCCNMLDYLSLKYRCSSSKFHSLPGVEIDQNICEIRNHELQLWVAFILCHKTRADLGGVLGVLKHPPSRFIAPLSKVFACRHWQVMFFSEFR